MDVKEATLNEDIFNAIHVDKEPVLKPESGPKGDEDINSILLSKEKKETKKNKSKHEDTKSEKKKKGENGKEEQKTPEMITKFKKTHWVTREMADEVGREYYLLTTLRDTVIFLIFLILATIINLVITDSSMFHFHRVIHKQMFEINGLENVHTASDVWDFLDGFFTKSFYWNYWYYPNNPVKKGQINETSLYYENKLLGVPRLRQVKVRNDSCPIHDIFKGLFVSCYSSFDYSSEDREPFGPGKGTAWTFHYESELGTTAYWGKVDWYHGGGYYQDLSLVKQKTLSIIKGLKQNLWITRGTRALFLDFSVYNANTNLFLVARAAFEFPPTGGVLTSARIQIAPLLKYSTPYSYFILACEVLVFCFIVFYTFEEIREIFFFRYKYLTMFWSYIDLTIIIFGYLILSLGIARTITVYQQIEEIVANQNKYANLDKASTFQMYYRNFLALQLFFIYMKIFKYLNFNKNMAQLNNTLSKCRKDMAGFLLMFLVVFVAFAILGYLLFGTEVEDFVTFYRAMFTLLRTILGDFNYEEIEKANRIIAPIYFLLFIFLVFFILLNMFLAIINDTYTDVKTEIAISPEELHMTGFIKRGYYNILIKLGLAKYVKSAPVHKNEYEMTTNEIKNALKKIGFSNLEIEMFFARYNIDPNATVKEYDIQKLVDALEGKEPIVPEDDHPKETEDGKPLIALDDFIKQQEKLDEIEEALNRTTDALYTLLERLEKLENVKKIAKETK